MEHPSRLKRFWNTALLAILLSPAPALGATWGLVVGINHYHHERDLRGAVNDAEDIAKALKAVGARRVVLLLDDEATRANIKANWQHLTRQARPGDALVFTFAGHGTQEPEHVPGTEKDHKDEVLLLGGFQKRRPGSAERILDNELNKWFSESPELNIIFVADTCHSGTLTRSIDPRAALLGSRAIGYYGPIEDEPLPPPAIMAKPDGKPLPHVTFLAAGQEDEKTVEINVDGKPRGALSWAFSQALRGMADTDRNGILDRRELRSYLEGTVSMHTEGRQHPRLEPLAEAQADRQLLPIALRGKPAPTSAPIRLKVIGLSDKDGASLIGRLRHTVAISASQLPDLIWDHHKREMLSANGDIVARLSDPSIDGIQGVIDKWWLLVRTLKQLGGPDDLRLRLELDGEKHQGEKYKEGSIVKGGSIVSFMLSGHRYAYLTLFNLAQDGTVQFLYPRKRDAKTVPIGVSFQLLRDIRVVPPFGSDHLIAIVTPKELSGLHGKLRGLHGSPGAAALNEVLAHRDWESYQLGILPFYTEP